MSLSITNESNRIIHSHQTKELRTRDHLSKIVNKVTSLAIPVIAIAILTNTPTASADNFTNCIEMCDRHAEQEASILCYTLCFVWATIFGS